MIFLKALLVAATITGIFSAVGTGFFVGFFLYNRLQRWFSENVSSAIGAFFGVGLGSFLLALAVLMAQEAGTVVR